MSLTGPLSSATPHLVSEAALLEEMELLAGEIERLRRKKTDPRTKEMARRRGGLEPDGASRLCGGSDGGGAGGGRRDGGAGARDGRRDGGATAYRV